MKWAMPEDKNDKTLNNNQGLRLRCPWDTPRSLGTYTHQPMAWGMCVVRVCRQGVTGALDINDRSGAGGEVWIKQEIGSGYNTPTPTHCILKLVRSLS